MVTIYSMLVARHFAGALLFFPIVWILMRQTDGKKLKISNWWLLAGLFATALLAGAVRFISIYVIGFEATLNPEGYLGVFFFLGLPIFVAIGVCAFLRTKSIPDTKDTNA